MRCPNCGYEPTINEFDWCDAPGRFYELGLKAEQEPNSTRCHPDREPVLGCPNCGVMFMNMGYVGETK